MAGTTTYYGISYPTSTDYVKDGATAMQTIATGFDSAVAIPTYNNQTGTSYTFVLADTGKTVTSDNASAVTFTIPPQSSVAWANNTTLTVRNLGAGVVTIAGGAGVTVTNTAQTVAQYGEVKLIRTASNAWTVVPASGNPSGLTLLNTTTFTSLSTVSVNNVFSSTYKNYRLLLRIDSAINYDLKWKFRTGGTDNSNNNYTFAVGYTTTTFNGSRAAGTTTSPTLVVNTGQNGLIIALDIYTPFATENTYWSGIGGANDIGNTITGSFNTTTSFDGFSLLSTGTALTGYFKLYGYLD